MRILALLCILPALALADGGMINVTVYYESLCPDSQRFINNQLYPTYKTPLAAFMHLMLVPYGNANTSASGITCQHGPTECYGNRVQACAIAKISMQDKQVAFINCLMKMAFDNKPGNNSEYKAYINQCANNVSLADQVSMIESCAENMSESDPLMYIYGNMTKNANPPIKGVPTIFFNEKSNKDINTNAQNDFTAELCKYISGNKPPECKSGKGSATDIAGSALLVISALVLSRFH